MDYRQIIMKSKKMNIKNTIDGTYAHCSSCKIKKNCCCDFDDGIDNIVTTVKEMIEAYISYPDVDESRVYIMGLSMGGFATFDMIARYPELFAAAVPICGAVDPSRMKDVKGVSIRIYHGDADKVVPVECSRMAYRALREAGADVEYFEFPGCGHLSWNPAFSQPDFMEWLFKQKKARKYMK